MKAVKILEVYQTTITVDTDDDAIARSMAEDILAKGKMPDGTELPKGEYDYTLESDEWPVWEA
jgi:hypothetical protein